MRSLGATSGIDGNDKEILAAAASVFWIGALTKLLFPTLYSDVQALFGGYVQSVGHSIPYLDFGVEYPPPVGMLIWTAGFFTWVDPKQPALGYGLFQASVIFPFAVAIVYYSLRIAAHIGVSKTRVGLIVVASATFFYFTYFNWDAPTVALMLGAIYYFLKRRPRIAYVMLSLGASIKIYPLVLLPLFWLYSDAGWKPTAKRLTLIRYFIYPLLLINAPFAILAPTNFARMLSVNFVTGANFWIEDSWLIYPNILVFQRDYYATRLTSYLIIGGLGLLSLYRFRDRRDDRTFVRISLMLVIAGIFGFTGVPPQFMLMAIPLLALVDAVDPYLARFVDLVNVLIIVMWFTYDTGPFGVVTAVSSLRQWILLAVYVLLLQRDRARTADLSGLLQWLRTPIRGE